ncbi:hypothetical protein GH714_012505 [Hevea brasiliensis]|uniref:Uncharacterized protein n=1 Tax=Hevea brasiliensis TaxID=3981 RepID=A0A6A6K5E0_HEVBR|nr:hypothetical protein GH714_012505 [Hevea brasiliensis]
MSLAYCVKEQKPCVHWVDKYFKDCLCNLKDEFSFAFGLISLVCWGVAEIPQIITNFRTKSSHGVSLLFLLTWVAGDVFNLVGCLLEPATLPTQFYTALVSAVCWLASSARSMASSGTPPFRGYLRNARSGPSAMVLDNESSSDDDAAPVSAKSVSQPRPIPRSAGYGTFLATSVNLPLKVSLTDAYIGFNGRRLLHEGSGTDHNAFDSCWDGLWLLIYGWPNPSNLVKWLKSSDVHLRTSGNLTYVLSILVRNHRMG